MQLFFRGKNLNIFILHRPFQLMVAQLIIKQYINHNTNSNVLFFEGNIPEQLIEGSLWAEVNQIGYCDTILKGTKNTIEMLHSNVLKMTLGSGRDSIVSLYISDIAWATNNRLFFSRELSNRVNYNILCDGIGTYTDPGQSYYHKFRNLVKMTMGYLGMSARYTCYPGRLMGMDHKNIKGIFCFRPELIEGMYPNNALYPIDFGSLGDSQFDEGSRGACLFLDQPYKEYIRSDEWTTLRQDTVNYIQSKSYTDVFYKKHPACHINYHQDLFGINLKIITGDEPIESVMQNWQFKEVISYSSTALLNIKLMYGDAVIVTSLYSNRLNKVGASGGNYRRSIKEIFERVGVVVVEG